MKFLEVTLPDSDDVVWYNADEIVFMRDDDPPMGRTATLWMRDGSVLQSVIPVSSLMANLADDQQRAIYGFTVSSATWTSSTDFNFGSIGYNLPYAST